MSLHRYRRQVTAGFQHTGAVTQATHDRLMRQYTTDLENQKRSLVIFQRKQIEQGGFDGMIHRLTREIREAEWQIDTLKKRGIK